jgi:integrase
MGRILTLKIFSRVKDGKKYFGIFVPARFSASGKERTALFKRRADAERYKLELLAAWREQEGIPLSSSEIADARAAWRELSKHGLNGISLFEAVKAALPILRREAQMPIETLLEEFAALRRPDWRPKSENNFKIAAEKMLSTFRGRAVGSIVAAELLEWVRTLGESPTTRHHYKRTLSPAFNYAVRQGILTANPWERVELEKVRRETKPDILTVAEAVRIMTDCPEDCKAAYALLLFAGVRPNELARLTWGDIKDGFVHIPAAASKVRQHRNIDIQPNLAAWLDLYRDFTARKIIPTNWKRKDQATRATVGFANRQDVCRHSFASYHLAAFKNAENTKMQLGHSARSDTLFAHYRAAVTTADAELYFSINPPQKSASRPSACNPFLVS